MPLNILIVGAGVAGPALACLLQGASHRHNITVVDRSSSLRLAGQQIDLKNEGVTIIKKMNLLDTIKSHCVNETGLEIVDSKGKRVALFGASDSQDTSRRTLTSEYEFMRGDMVKMLYDTSLQQRAKLDENFGKEGSLTYKFETSISELTQDDDSANVTFSNGQTGRYDLVVGADGQSSFVRQLMFGKELSDKAFKSMGVHCALYTIPRGNSDGGLAQMFSVHRRRFVMTRNGNRPTTQAYLWSMDAESLKDSYKQPINDQKTIWTKAFQGAGWETERLLSGMTTCKDFYAYELGQVHLKQLHSGRAVLLGDSGYCPSPFTGLGTTLALIGAYILAGELTKHEGEPGRALKEYERLMKPPIEECQNELPPSLGLFFPSSKLGVWTLRNVVWAVSKFNFEALGRFLPEKKPGWKIPDYPELNLQS